MTPFPFFSPNLPKSSPSIPPISFPSLLLNPNTQTARREHRQDRDVGEGFPSRTPCDQELKPIADKGDVVELKGICLVKETIYA